MPVSEAIRGSYQIATGLNDKKEDGSSAKICTASLSYIISAPLHMEGIGEFWTNGRWPDRLAVFADFLLHLAFWVTAFVLEVWCVNQDHRGSKMLVEIGDASMWALSAALIGIAIAQFFAMLNGGQESGRLFAATYGTIVGGTYASIVFSIMWGVYSATSWAAMIAQYGEGDHLDDNLKVQRQVMLWSMALKIIAVATLTKNADFWGPAVKSEDAQARVLGLVPAQTKDANGLSIRV